jgi:hypothetical protein
MSNWKRTFKMDVVNVDGHNACAQVWSAITDASNALASIGISVDTDHGHASIRMALTPQQMHDLAFNLNVHANRLKELEAEAAALTQEAA